MSLSTTITDTITEWAPLGVLMLIGVVGLILVGVGAKSLKKIADGI